MKHKPKSQHSKNMKNKYINRYIMINNTQKNQTKRVKKKKTFNLSVHHKKNNSFFKIENEENVFVAPDC